MTNKIKYVMTIVGFVFVLSFILPKTVSKADELETPEIIEIDEPYETVDLARCGLYISNGTAYVSATVSGKWGTTYIGVTVYLEKYINGSWQPYTSWSHYDATSVNSSDSISVSSGTFRAWMTVTTQGILGCEEFDVNGNVAGC